MSSSEEIRKRVLSDNLKRFRKAKKFTQEMLAEASDLSIGAIKQIETCIRWPKNNTLEALAKALGVSSHDLLGAEAKKSPTVESLLVAMQEMTKEIETLKGLLSKIPSVWIGRLASKSQKDFGAVVARAFLTRDLSELRALELPARSMDHIKTLMEKNEPQDPS